MPNTRVVAFVWEGSRAAGPDAYVFLAAADPSLTVSYSTPWQRWYPAIVLEFTVGVRVLYRGHDPIPRGTLGQFRCLSPLLANGGRLETLDDRESGMH